MSMKENSLLFIVLITQCSMWLSIVLFYPDKPYIVYGFLFTQTILMGILVLKENKYNQKVFEILDEMKNGKYLK